MELSKDSLELAWYLAQFKPNCAMIAKRNLLRQGYQAFLPLETQTHVKRSRFVEETIPFFPGYIFIGATDSSSPVRTISSTYGVSQLVKVGTKAAQIPVQLIKELMSRCDGDGIVIQRGSLEKGEKVHVKRGPFANLIGEVERTDVDRRVWLLLDLIGQKTKVSIDQSVL